MYTEQIGSVRKLLQLYDITVPDIPANDDDFSSVAKSEFETTKKLLEKKTLKEIVEAEVGEW